jgi:hypothetical protein
MYQVYQVPGATFGARWTSTYSSTDSLSCQGYSTGIFGSTLGALVGTTLRLAVNAEHTD